MVTDERDLSNGGLLLGLRNSLADQRTDMFSEARLYITVASLSYTQCLDPQHTYGIVFFNDYMTKLGLLASLFFM